MAVRLESTEPARGQGAPHGGALVELVADQARGAELKRAARDWPSWALTPRQLCDLELLLNGGFSPLRGFMARRDYDSVCSSMRLASGLLWPIPIVLDVDEAFADELSPGQVVALRDPEGLMLAALHVGELYRPDRRAEAEAVYGTASPEHPGVAQLLERTHSVYLAGRIEGLQLPVHHDFRALRATPRQLRAVFETRGWDTIVAFQTRNPMHRAHHEMTLRAAREVGAKLLLHPTVGVTRPGDLDHYTRVRCYQALLARYPANSVMLSLLPLAMRMAGPREALWHAVIRKNYGCTHLIVGRDHAGPGSDSHGRPFYRPYAAQEGLEQHAVELGIRMVPFRVLVYVPDLDAYIPEDEAAGRHVLDMSGSELRRRLREGREIPQWFTFPEVARELRRAHPPRHRQGLTIFFTGLSGAGKSAIAGALQVRLLELGGRPVTSLDGDVVRKHLSSELGFSAAHRNINILRIGFVASEITKNGGIAICAPIAPYDAARKQVRQMVEAVGAFVMVHVATPLEVCEERDRKGMYAKARAGIVKEFTGISAPYEAPADAELVVDTTRSSPDEAAQEVLVYLEREGFIALGSRSSDKGSVAAERTRGRRGKTALPGRRLRRRLSPA
jgi:sulfate adenylyltransferase